MSVFPLKANSAYIKAYYAAIKKFHEHGHTTEGNTRSAFADLLKRCVRPYDWHLVEEYQFKGTGKQPLRADGALVDSLTLVRIFSENGSRPNQLICVSQNPLSGRFYVLAAAIVPDFHLTGDSQCFPFYTYDEDGTNRRENITDWALAQYRTHYANDSITKWDIFHSTSSTIPSTAPATPPT